MLHLSLKFGFPLVPTTLSWAAWPESENERLLGLARFRMTDAVSRTVGYFDEEDPTEKAMRRGSLRLLAATNPEQGVIMGRHCCDSDPRLDQLKAAADTADLDFPRGQTGADSGDGEGEGLGNGRPATSCRRADGRERVAGRTLTPTLTVTST